MDERQPLPGVAYLVGMSLTDMLGQLDSLTDEERLALANAALAGGEQKSAPVTANNPAIRLPTISKEALLREWDKLGPMDAETYARYKASLAMQRRIDPSDWE